MAMYESVMKEVADAEADEDFSPDVFSPLSYLEAQILFIWTHAIDPMRSITTCASFFDMFKTFVARAKLHLFVKLSTEESIMLHYSECKQGRSSTTLEDTHRGRFLER